MVHSRSIKEDITGAMKAEVNGCNAGLFAPQSAKETIDKILTGV
jgi:hypothetical protein